MVTQLISGIAYGIQAVTLPGSPTAIPAPLPSPSASTRLYLEFSCQNELIGRTVLKLVDFGRLGREFDLLVTGRLGYGYKGSRVYACCRNEWCLMGDLIYDAPAPPVKPLQDWDCRSALPSQPPEPGSSEGEADDGAFLPRKLHRGYGGLPECEVRACGGAGGGRDGRGLEALPDEPQRGLCSDAQDHHQRLWLLLTLARSILLTCVASTDPAVVVI
ncbi:uncharacterized protein [Penaeus vannamei]|uniref:uncharacterized protein isoform X2 n=1 Tax=Penaeus vannamei TaxID=6689 RepID=UPI00387F45DC